MGKLFIRDLFGLRALRREGQSVLNVSCICFLLFIPTPLPSQGPLWFVEIIARAWNWSHCLQLPPPGTEQEMLQRPCRLTLMWFYWAEQKAQAPYPEDLRLVMARPPVPWHGRFPGHCPPLPCPIGPRLQAGPVCFHLLQLCPCQSHWPGCPSHWPSLQFFPRLWLRDLDLAGIGSNTLSVCQVLNRF